jgi:virginiamycin A acetyltransferase
MNRITNFILSPTRLVKHLVLYTLHLLYKFSICNCFHLIGIKLGAHVAIKGTYISRNVTIDKHTKLFQSSVIGNTYVGESCEIIDSEVHGKIHINDSSQILSSKLCGTINIGKESLINGANINGDFTCKEHLRIFGPQVNISGNVDIGRYSSISGPNFDIFSRINKVKIGSFCSIARNVSFQEYSHYTNKLSTYFINQHLFGQSIDKDINSKGDIVVENDVWIGAHSVILSGAHISTGAIIAANSVVNCYVPPYSIVGGSPAKIIRYRFDTDVIDTLLRLEWWNWNKEEIHKHKDIFNLDFSKPDNINILKSTFPV